MKYYIDQRQDKFGDQRNKQDRQNMFDNTKVPQKKKSRKKDRNF